METKQTTQNGHKYFTEPFCDSPEVMDHEENTLAILENMYREEPYGLDFNPSAYHSPEFLRMYQDSITLRVLRSPANKFMQRIADEYSAWLFPLPEAWDITGLIWPIQGVKKVNARAFLTQSEEVYATFDELFNETEAGYGVGHRLAIKVDLTNDDGSIGSSFVYPTDFRTVEGLTEAAMKLKKLVRPQQ